MNYEDYYWLNEDAITFLKKDYLKEGEDPKQRFRDIAEHAEKLLGIKGFADKFEYYIKRGFYSFSTPVMSNYGRKEKVLPCSCNNSHIEDSIESILSKVSEVGTMTKYGAGTSAYFGDVRPRGSLINIGDEVKSTGAVHFMQLFDEVSSVISQGSARRGSFAAYLPIYHGDIKEFLNIKNEGHPIQDISFGVTIPDWWMNQMIDGDKEKRELWATVLKSRSEKGYPYLFFYDNVNNNAPQVYKDKGYKINSSNLCTEILEVSDEKWSFVCNIGSINLLRWDEIEKTDAIETYLYFLDSVNTEYIEKTKNIKFLETAHRYCKEHRGVGLGVLGWHSYLQSKMVPFESMEAKMINVRIFKEIKNRVDNANKDLAKLFGEPEVLKGYGLRCSTTMAVAPTKSSSLYLGQVSPSIEPYESNYFIYDSAKGKFTHFNPFLEELLIDLGKNDFETRNSILKRGGSVQHLDFLTEHQKDVFKTFGEISQKEIIIQASARQKYIDQGQSLNLKISNTTSLKDINQLYIFAWENGIKTLYYQKGVNPSQELSRSILECKSCEG